MQTCPYVFNISKLHQHKSFATDPWKKEIRKFEIRFVGIKNRDTPSSSKNGLILFELFF